MKIKFLKRVLSIVICMMLLLNGTIVIGLNGLDLFSVNASALSSSEQIIMKYFIIDEEYLDYISLLEVYPDFYEDAIFSFNMYDFDGDGDLELIIETSIYNHTGISVFKVSGSKVKLLAESFLYKSSYGYAVKDENYHGFVCKEMHPGSDYAYGCMYFSMEGEQLAFEREYNYNGQLTGYSFSNADELDDELLDLLLDEEVVDYNLKNDNLVPLYFYDLDEIRVIGWDEFLTPTWSRAYYNYYLDRTYSNEFIDSNNPDDAELGIKDLNCDGIPELIVGDPWHTGRNGHGAIYTYKNGDVKYVGYADSSGGYFTPHAINDIDYPGFYTYIYTYDSSYNFLFYIVYYSFDGNEISQTEVCSQSESDYWDESEEYKRITDDEDLYKAVVDSINNNDYELTEECDLDTENNWDAMSWPELLVKYLKKTPKFYYTNGDESGSKEFKYYDVETYIKEKSSTEYDPRMSAFAASMANAAGYEKNLKKTFAELGITKNHYYTDYYDKDSWGVCTAFSIADQVTEDDKTIVYVTLRGTRGFTEANGFEEWANNILGGVSGYGKHAGFELCASIIKEKLDVYLRQKNIASKNATFIITGHSRGAAAANLLTVKMIDEGFSKNKIYCYTLACPDTAILTHLEWQKLSSDNKYNNIFNINNTKDPVSYVPGLLGDGFSMAYTGGSTVWGKYGSSYWYSLDWNSLDQVEMDFNFADTKAHVHNQYHYWEYLADKDTLPDKSQFKGRDDIMPILSSLANAAGKIIDDMGRAVDRMGEAWNGFWSGFGSVFGIHCPVDFVITDSKGNKLASVIDHEAHYYNSSFGSIMIATAGDEAVVFIKSGLDCNINLVGTDNGKMSMEVYNSNLYKQSIDQSRGIEYKNVALYENKKMTFSVKKDPDSGNTKLFVTDDAGNITAEILPDGTERAYSGLKVKVDDSIKLKYKKSMTLIPVIEVNQGVKYTVKYSSSDPKVATVDQNGKVTATKRGSGSATITCTVTDEYGNVVKDTCKVDVKLSFGQWLIVILLFGWIWY